MTVILWLLFRAPALNLFTEEVPSSRAEAKERYMDLVDIASCRRIWRKQNFVVCAGAEQ